MAAINRLITSTNALSKHVRTLGTRIRAARSPPSSASPSSPRPNICLRHIQETPLSRPDRVNRMVTCHGCHGPIGQGQHQGSELGKLKCNLPHSLYCRGGVVEDESWRGCPIGYQYNPSIDLASNGVGFERTMHSYEFQSQYQPTMDPAFSTPANGVGQVRAAHQLPPFPSSLRSISPADRMPSRIYMAPQGSDQAHGPTQDQIQSQHPQPNVLLNVIPGGIQDKISEHRAAS